MARAAVVSLVPLLGLVFAACGQDFDALFALGPDAGAGAEASAPPAVVPDDAQTDAGVLPAGDAGCLPSPQACAPPLVCGPEVCDYTCGCGCTCPWVECDPGGGATTCNAVCEQGATCDLKCDVGGACNYVVHGSRAKLHCSDDPTSCTTTCDGASSCEVRCENSGPCQVSCVEGSKCLLRCTARPASCDLACPDGQKKECATGVYACNRACP